MNSRQRRKLEADAFSKFKVLREKAYRETNVGELPWQLWWQFMHKWDMKNWRKLIKSPNEYE